MAERDFTDRGKDIPADIREKVIARDGNCCRLCGKWVEYPHLHHIVYRSQGGNHTVDNLISLDYSCHSTRAHGSEASMWRRIFTDLVHLPGITGVALRRWKGL